MNILVNNTTQKRRILSLFALAICSILLIFVATSCSFSDSDEIPTINDLFTCNDKNNDHLCDVCSGVMSECVDKNNDHLCEICEKETTYCPTDVIRDHICDICGFKASNCFDNDNTHICDYCGRAMIGCKDQNYDHFCDLCKLKITICEDLDQDHLCDVCSKGMTHCKEGTVPDHICDYCGGTISVCEDKSHDHLCDICKAVLSVCSDTNSDHLCDICKTALTKCVDNSGSLICNICGNKMPWITITMAENCLVNGGIDEHVYRVCDSYFALFSYVGSNENTPTGWIIYDKDGIELLIIEGSNSYSFTEGGFYHVVPVFTDD